MWGREQRSARKEKAPTQQNFGEYQGVRFASHQKRPPLRGFAAQLFWRLALDPKDKSCCPGPAFSSPDRKQTL
jgi:hypothetical protein